MQTGIPRASVEEKVRRVLTEDVLTIPQAQAELQAIAGHRPDRATISRWILKGRLDAVRIGRQWLTSKQAITRFIVERSA